MSTPRTRTRTGRRSWQHLGAAAGALAVVLGSTGAAVAAPAAPPVKGPAPAATDSCERANNNTYRKVLDCVTLEGVAHLAPVEEPETVAGLLRQHFLGERAGTISDLESGAIARYLVNREKEVARLHRTVGPSWRGVAGIGFRRALGRTLAQL